MSRPYYMVSVEVVGLPETRFSRKLKAQPGDWVSLADELHYARQFEGDILIRLIRSMVEANGGSEAVGKRWAEEYQKTLQALEAHVEEKTVMGRKVLKEVYLCEEYEGTWAGTHMRVTEIGDTMYTGFVTYRGGSGFESWPKEMCRDK